MSGIIGVAGCGRMGGPMLANLQSAGFDARGYDPRPAAGVGTDFGAFCAGLTTLVTVVRDAAETDHVYRTRCIPRKAQLDLIYQARRSICFDLVLIGRTAAKPFRRH